jgi:flagellar basal-body rod modification protein FlgD
MAAATSITSKDAQDQFLQLLVSQLQNQDPMEPVGQQEFIQQLSQFSMLQGIEKLNTSFDSWMKIQTLSEGASFTGKTVEYMNSDSQKVTGVVQSAHVKDGSLLLTIDGKDISFDNVTGVVNATTP